MGWCSDFGEVFSFIPRMVVHKEEVDRIFFPQQLPSRKSRSEAQMQESDDEEGEASTNVEVSGRSIFLRGTTVPDLSALVSAIRNLAFEIPENIRTTPALVATLATGLPLALATMAIELPSNLRNVVANDLPTTIISLVEGVEGTFQTIVQVSSGVAREVVELPHRASFQWRQLIWILLLLVFVPVLIFGLVFFVPLSSVNDGVAHNRSFIYGTMTFYQVLTIAPWIETCNFALPQADIPVKARIVTLIAAVVGIKVYEVALTEGAFGTKVFPIPFSIVVSGIIGVFGIVPLLKRMTPERDNADWIRMRKVLMAYILSLTLVILWAFGIQKLSNFPLWQAAFSFVYGPLRFFSKILLAAPVATQLNPHRWIQLNLVLDILFTRVQVATFPFIDNFVTLLLLFSTEVLTLAWRYYNGVDRLALWWNAMSMVADQENASPTSESLGKTMRSITRGCFGAPIPQIAQWNLSLREKKFQPERIVRTLTGDTELSFVEDVNQPKTGEGEKHIDPCIIDFEKELDEGESLPIVVMDIEAACAAADREVQEFGEQANDGEHSLEQSRSSLFSASTEEETIAGLSEENWEQRPIYHVVDSTGSNVISIIVRANQQFSITMVRYLPSAQHLNESFKISDEHWKQAQIYGWTFVALMLILLGVVGCTFFRRLQQLEGRKLSLSRVMSYLYKDHFWFFFLWLVSTGGFVCASMVNHFGADFSFKFDWVTCPREMEWPKCSH